MSMKKQSKKIPEGWEEVRLGDMLTLHYGKSLLKKNRSGNGFPVYGSAGVIGFHNKPLISEGGIIVGRKGSVGVVYRCRKSFYPIDTSFYLTKEDTAHDLDYLFYFLQFLRLDRLNTDSAVPGLNRDVAYMQALFLPPLQEQKEIAGVLGVVDEEIGVVGEIVEKYEVLRRGLMQDFFADDEKEGWEEVRLGDVCEVRRGNTITKKDVISGDVPVIAGGQKPTYYHNKANRSGNIITVSGSGAYAGFVNFFDYPVYASDCSTIIPKNKSVDIKFVFYFLKSKQNYIYNLQSGGGQPHVYPKDLQEMKIFLPPLKEQRKVVEVLQSVDETIDIYRKEKEALERLKKGLMQDLLSGEVRVGGV